MRVSFFSAGLVLLAALGAWGGASLYADEFSAETDGAVEEAQYLEESLTHRDPEQEAMIQDLVD
jgi:hypothetical protein